MFELQIAITIVLLTLMAGMQFLIFRHCYKIVGADQALIKTGLGGPRVETAGGVLIVPVVHQAQTISLTWQPLEIDFRDSPLVFSDQETLAAQVTVWLEVNSTPDDILEAARSFGDRCGEPHLVSQLYAVSTSQAIRKAASENDREQWLARLPDISPDVYRSIEAAIDPFLVIARITLEPNDKSL